MSIQIFLPVVAVAGLFIIPLCSCRWNFLDSNGHRIRHNRYWKLDYSVTDLTTDCPPSPKSPNFESCPKLFCQSDYDCRVNFVQPSRCFCDKQLCGRVCISFDIQCESLDNLLNGRVNLPTNNKPGAVASFQCDDGFSLYGSSKRHCQANGQWSGTRTTCLPQIYCSNPPFVPNAEIDIDSGNDNFVAGSTVTYRCFEGYTSNSASPEAICSSTGHWIGPNFRCEPISCGRPGFLLHGYSSGSKFLYMQNVTFSCKKGYVLKCPDHVKDQEQRCSVRVCQANGQWSGYQPVCKPISCPLLKAPLNGRVSSTRTEQNSVLTFSCNPGYNLVGSVKRRCRRGVWSGRNVTCRILSCGEPPFIPQARVNYTDTNFGATATYRCVVNSSFHGPPKTIACDHTGRWKPEPVMCVQNCLPGKIRAGKFEVQEKGDGSFIPSRNGLCDDGYLLRNPLFPVCYNGTWSLSPVCQPKPCSPKLPMRANTQLYFYSLEHGSRASYNCTLGFMPTSGQSVLQCHLGRWTGDPLVCKLSTCARPAVPRHGKIYLVGLRGRWLYSEPSIRVQHEDTIEYQCRAGYVLRGRVNAVCVNGKWLPAATPRCERRSPGDFASKNSFTVNREISR